MKLVVIESPFAAGNGRTVDENLAYARACMRDALLRGEAPIASHLLYTQPGILDDDHPDERRLGIECGLIWARQAEVAAFYTDHGMSRGMEFAIERHRAEGRAVEIRSLTPAAE